MNDDDDSSDSDSDSDSDGDGNAGPGGNSHNRNRNRKAKNDVSKRLQSIQERLDDLKQQRGMPTRKKAVKKVPVKRGTKAKTKTKTKAKTTAGGGGANSARISTATAASEPTPALPASTAAEKERRKAEQQARALQKQREKEERKQQREQLRQQREKQKQAKKHQTKQAQQANGRFAHQEIVVLLDPLLLDNGEYALHSVLKETFLIQEYDWSVAQRQRNKQSRIIQWIRKDFMEGGAAEALDGMENKRSQSYQHIRRILVFLNANEFIPLLKRRNHEDDDDYPLLADYVSELMIDWQQAWGTTSDPKISLLLYRVPDALDEMWINQRNEQQQQQHGQQQHGQQLPTESEFHDALQWLLIQYRVESIQCSTIEQIQSTVFKMTRAIAEAPYKTHVTELQCIKKIKAAAPTAEDTWLRQLQMFPRVSEIKARNVVAEFPTVDALVEAYGENPDAGPALLAKILSKGKTNEVLLSQSIYRFFMSTNPMDMV